MSAQGSSTSLSSSSSLRERLRLRFSEVRAQTEALVQTLSPEDQNLQSMPSCSPAKWHRAHTTWFFETFLLAPRGIAPYSPRFSEIFNSYYVAVGPRHARPLRGLLSRPSAAEITAYRSTIETRMVELLSAVSDVELPALTALVELGLAHEEQHQELLLTDVLHAFSLHPHKPAFFPGLASSRPTAKAVAPRRAARFVAFEGGLVQVGAEPQPGATDLASAEAYRFHFDNEEPRHKVWLEPFELCDRLLTIGEWRAFADAGGYRDASHWLSDGFDWIMREGIEAPLYARREGETVVVFDHGGEREASDDEPVTHLSGYEADAIARFFGARLPSEAEWEHAVSALPVRGNFRERGLFRPEAVRREAAAAEGRAPRLEQVYGDAWEWTQSSYGPYPGFAPAGGALGEYNGKFMANQLVLRGGSCLTPERHMRASYRNFWYPDTQFQKTGVRLARSLSPKRTP